MHRGPDLHQHVTVNGNGSYTSDAVHPDRSRHLPVGSGLQWRSQQRPGGLAVQRSNESVVVTQAGPTHARRPRPPPPLGSSITDTATLAGGASPTGTLTFTLFGPDDANCSGTPAFTSTETVDGNGSYTSDPVHPDSGRHLPVGRGLQRRCRQPRHHVTLQRPQRVVVVTRFNPPPSRHRLATGAAGRLPTRRAGRRQQPHRHHHLHRLRPGHPHLLRHSDLHSTAR